ncbi:uncharacterized protein LTR77_004338 [Saxophila tyrrhenica]|uniref:Uncharacterized protein n=1 Tax=Saxophila tyrrhenica TaxID=1690608 RepID=A0AAV9PCN8_9PEZI|nr:hypothetical protein LTR77_004338 [Saxophila tyrrhenica]
MTEYPLTNNSPVTPEAATAATNTKDTRTLDLLLENRWDINESLSPATLSALALVVDEEDPSLTSWLLDRGASPSTQCALDLTPLPIAVQFSPLSIIQSLFDHGGEIKCYYITPADETCRIN